MKKKFIATLLALVMVLGILATGALATDNDIRLPEQHESRFDQDTGSYKLQDGDNVTVSSDITGQILVPAGVTATVTIPSGLKMTSGGGFAPIKVEAGGTLTLTGEGSIERTGDAYYLVENHGTLTIGGSLKIDNSSNVTISGDQTGTAVFNDKDATLTVSDSAEIKGKAIGIRNDGSITVSGGTFKDMNGTNANTDVEKYIEDGKTLNEDGTVDELDETNSVAKIDNTYYATLADALEAATADQTVTLLQDTDGLDDTSITVTIALDLGSKTLNLNQNMTLIVAADVTIKNGAIKQAENSTRYCAVQVSEGANLIIDDVEISGYDGITVYDSSTLTVNSGKITGKITGISTYGNDTENAPTITIVDGEISATDSDGVGMYLPANGKTTIEGGTISGNASAIEIRGGSLTVTGGTITGTEASVADNGRGIFDEDEGTLDGIITGGTFSSDVSDYVADGYEQNEAGEVIDPEDDDDDNTGTTTPSTPTTPTTPTTPAEPEYENPYDDVDAESGAWYLDTVQYVTENGLMEGYDEGDEHLFGVGENITRAQLVQILYNMEGKPASDGECVFPDVNEDGWYVDAILWAAENGIVDGYEDGTFRPDDYITREETAAVLYRYAVYKGYDVSAEGDLSVFADAEAVSEWAAEYVTWAVGAGIILGHDDGTVAPQGSALREEAAAMLQRFHQNFVK